MTFHRSDTRHDHYKGSFGGRVLPLWRDRAAKEPNIKPALLAHLAKVYAQAGESRRRDGLPRRRDGASGFHGALQGRSRSPRLACSV